MRQVQLIDDNQQLAALIGEVEAGESVTILRRGQPVAQIIPFSAAKESVAVAEEAHCRREAAIKRISDIMREGIPLGGTPPTRDEMHDGR